MNDTPVRAVESGNTGQESEMVRETINSVLHQAYSFNAGESAIFRHAAGLRARELKMNARILLQSLFNEKPSESLRDAVLAGLEVFCLQRSKSGKVRFKNQAAYFYRKALKDDDKGCVRRIENLAKNRKNGNRRFYKDLISYCRYVISKDQLINVASLIRDVYYWDTHRSKDQWIEAFSDSIKEKGETNNEQEQGTN
ncbi:MAG: hypothetical protein J5966_10560 [Lachnospiraceae bacterium]|nr:hypothetical protein [Lachnospiraceae bacterium]